MINNFTLFQKIFHHLLVIPLCLLLSQMVQGQCTNTTPFPSVVTNINPSGTQVTITTCNFAGEYAAVGGAVAGQTLRFTSSITTDIITIHSGSPGGPVVAFGPTPLQFANTFTGTLYAHWNTAGCGTQFTCRTTNVQCMSCGVADLSITKTDFVTTYTPGSNGHTYIIEATNNGPVDVTGATITDVLPPEITSATWTVTYFGGGSGPASGSGNINAVVDLPNLAKARFTVTAHISPSANTTMTNTAAVEPPPSISDPNLANNSATDIDTPKTTDMSITKTDGTATYTPGGTTTYIITVTNNGTQALAEKSVIDNLPPEITSASWTAAYTGGATGPASGSGNINVLVDFPAGSSATFTIVATISPSATGPLVNTASIPVSGYVDPNPADNTATDTDIPPCTNTTQFPSVVTNINPGGALVTITTCSFAGEYSVINGAVAGQTLRFTTSVPTDVITIHSGSASGPVIASGTTPLTFPNTFTGTLYAHWNTPGCGTQSTCRTTTVQCITCTVCTITCPANITVSNDANQCGAIVNYPAPTTSGSCGTVTTTPASGTLFPIGTTTVTATSTAGPTCSFTVTVNDTQAPVMTCLPNVTVSCASAVPAAAPGSVQVTDNCPGAVVTHVGDVIVNQTCSNRFTINRTYKATDAAGNFSTCVQTITVNDITPPTLTCPAPVTVSCASAVPAPNIALVTGVSDNCAGAGAVTVSFVSDVISNQTCANKYTITRTYKATDACGNSATCTQLITVNDVTPPVITCPANINATTPVGSCTAIVNFTPTATDNCSGAVTIVSTPASGTAFPIGTTTVNSVATDVCGNSSSCTFTVTVADGQLPVISAQPANRTVCATTNALFTVTASNVVSYQWQSWNGLVWNNISGATGSTLTVSNVGISQNATSYRAVLTGLCTVVISNAATLYVNPLPTITLTSAQTSLLPAQQTSITAVTNPPGGSYIWMKNNSAVSGANSAVIGPLTISDIGTYKVTYTDLNGCVNTSGNLVIEATPSDNMWVYPNPNNGQFQVRYYNGANEQVNLQVFDAKGTLVYHKLYTTSLPYTGMQVDLGPVYIPGTYLVEIRNALNKQVAVKRVTVLR